MKMKASIPDTLPRNKKKRKKKRALKRKNKVPAAWRDFTAQPDLQKQGKERKKGKAFSLGFFYRTILHCCWVCIKWHSWLEEEGFWVEGSTEIYIFNGLISSWRGNAELLSFLSWKVLLIPRALSVALPPVIFSSLQSPLHLLFYLCENTVYHLTRFVTNAEQDCIENTATCTVRLVVFYWGLFQDSKTLIYQLSPLETAFKAQFLFTGERSLSLYLQSLVISWGDRQVQAWGSLTEFCG